MKCPYCSFEESKVIDSRATEEGAAIRRRRECMECQKRFTSYEKIETIPVVVIKKDKSREVFDREKVLTGIMRACEKRPIEYQLIECLVDDIENHIHNTFKKEITSKRVGEMIMEKLKDIDEVAYVRFASVYRQFKDVNTFIEEINKILHQEQTE